jgi:hypothetical protein
LVYWRNEPTLICDFSDDGRVKTFRVIYQLVMATIPKRSEAILR